MKISTLLSAFACITLLSATSFAQCGAPTNIYIFTYNGSTYELIRENLTWESAAACAVGRGGYLAEIEDVAENTAVFNEITTNGGVTFSNTTAPDGGGGSYVWLGGNDLETEGSWMWDGNNDGLYVPFWLGDASGSPVAGHYNNWGNEPDDYNGQDALGLSLNGWPLGVAGEWNDVDDQNTLYFLVEFPINAGSMELENEFEMYPNPFDDVITITSSDQLAEVVFRTSLGQEVKRVELNAESNTEINVADLDSNLYFVELIAKNGKSVVRKLVK